MVLEIRSQQLASMQRCRDEEFAEQLLAMLRTEYSERGDVWQRKKLLQSVLGYLAKARRYGLTTDRELRAFVSLQLFVREGWDEFPPIAEILRNTNFDAGSRLEHVLFGLDEEDWLAVKAWTPGKA